MIGVLVSGQGTNLQALIDAGLPIAAVASNRPDAAALARAEAAGIPARVFLLEAYADRSARDRELADWLQLRGVDLVVLAGYMHLLTSAFLDRFLDAIVNVHPSLLPAFPGAHAVEDALAAGVDTTGVTVHYVDEGLDTGAVIRQEQVAVEPRTTLVERIHAVEHRLLPEVVRELLVSTPWVGAGAAGPEGTVLPSTGPEGRAAPASAGGGGGGLRPPERSPAGEARCAR
jgi:phosphoribosylglycinamide formyltransferase-1